MSEEEEGGGIQSYQVASTYEVEGDNIEKKNPSCPKCGQGYRLAVHEDRKTCGRCGYTEFE